MAEDPPVPDPCPGVRFSDLPPLDSAPDGGQLLVLVNGTLFRVTIAELLQRLRP